MTCKDITPTKSTSATSSACHHDRDLGQAPAREPAEPAELTDPGKQDESAGQPADEIEVEDTLPDAAFLRPAFFRQKAPDAFDDTLEMPIPFPPPVRRR